MEEDGGTTAVVVLVTLPAAADAAAFAGALVGERLAACVGVGPLGEAVYRWAGAVERAAERQLLIKTTGAQVERLRQRVSALHPYDTPEFLVLEARGGDRRYLEWIVDSVGPEPSPPAR